MVARGLALAALAGAGAAAAQTGTGLVVGPGEWMWPQLQARINIQTTALTPVALTRGGDFSVGSLRGVQGGSLLGDYVFAAPAFGNFRATSGVMLGSPGGAPLLNAAPSPRLSVSVLDGGASTLGGYADNSATLPYLGLGYSSPEIWRSFQVSADLGVVAGRPAGLPGLGRAIFGNQPVDAAVRDLRLAPMLQLGMRYRF